MKILGQHNPKHKRPHAREQAIAVGANEPPHVLFLTKSIDGHRLTKTHGHLQWKIEPSMHQRVKKLLAERMAQNKLRTTAAVKETVTRAAWLQAPYACDPMVSSAVEAPSRKNLENGLMKRMGTLMEP